MPTKARRQSSNSSWQQVTVICYFFVNSACRYGNAIPIFNSWQTSMLRLHGNRVSKKAPCLLKATPRTVDIPQLNAPKQFRINVTGTCDLSVNLGLARPMRWKFIVSTNPLNCRRVSLERTIEVIP
ncbi:hypothetical protein T05_13527 [Trichinella murrelli]|uniref:Uncharacterized protein n=1 Tax=Trichinella murrelli TaxID=144512 RepID=A0A0V0TN48_9BILA|nr:hypothetical protein T05_13527 [Trichinella murrelli]